MTVTFKAGEKLVMIGDSITDCGRSRPLGEGANGLGNGYVAVVDAWLKVQHPELNLRIVNAGSSGHTVRDLNNRWQTDVLDVRPDWLSIMIGINDVWRQFDQPTLSETHVYLDEYETTLRALVESSKRQVKGIVLMTPYYLEPHLDDPMRATMDLYGSAVARVASETGSLLVDTQQAFAPILTALYPAALGWDRVHPNLAGHLVIAKAFLRAVGYDWAN